MTRSKKILSILMSLVMIVLSIPAFSLTAHAEDTTTITHLDLTYDTGKIVLNTAYTEGEVQDLLRVSENMATRTEGTDISNRWLSYKDGSGTRGVGDGSNPVSASREYYIEYDLCVTSGYDWVDSIKPLNLGETVSLSSLSGLTVNVNDTPCTDALIGYNPYRNSAIVYIPVGNGKDIPVIRSLAIDQTPFSLQCGETADLTATITGTATDLSYSWSLSGNSSTDTTISSDGKLQIAADETAKSITVTVTSNFDSTRSDSITVTVTQEAPTISKMEFDRPAAKVYVGSSTRYSVDVEGTQTDKSLIWSVSGNTSSDTKITYTGSDSYSSYVNGYAYLTIGTDETAPTVTLRATSVADPAKYVEYVITILQTERITELALNYDADAIYLNNSYTEGEVETQIKNNISTSTTGVSLDKSNCTLFFTDSTSHDGYCGIGDGSAPITAGRQYHLVYCLKVSSSVDWTNEIKALTENTDISSLTSMTLTVNGAPCNTATLYYHSNNTLKVIIPFGLGQCAHTYDYTSNEDGTHTYHCTKADDSTGAEACTYVDGICSKCHYHAHNYTSAITTQPTCNAEGVKTYTCSICSHSYTEKIAKLSHSYSSAITTQPTCNSEGVKTYTCSLCRHSYTEKIAKLSHSYSSAITTQPTCNSEGVKTYTCSLCRHSYTEKIAKPAHSYKTVVTKATEKADGTIANTCEKCKYTASKTTIPKITNVQMTKTDLVYNGKKQTPAITVTDRTGKVLKNGTDYKVTYPKNRKNVGVYTAKVTFKGNYTGTKSLTFRIDPKAASLKKLKAQKKGFQVTWKKQTSQTTGYEVQYSTKKNFKKGTKTITVKKNSKTSATVSKLSAKKKYYVRIRTYKTVKVNGKNTKLYSDWSSVKNVKTKK